MYKLVFITILFVALVQIEAQHDCADRLVPLSRACDTRHGQLDKVCSAIYAAYKVRCGGKDTIECGADFKVIDADCKGRYAAFHDDCGPVYDEYQTKCASKKEKVENNKEVVAGAKDDM